VKEMTDMEAAIMHPGSSQQREQGLRALLASPSPPSPSLATFLEGFRTDDRIQAAMVGLLLRRLHPEEEVPLGLLARVFPALGDAWEPELQAQAIALFAGRSPRQVYADLADQVGHEQGSELERFYAYNVLANVDHASLRDDAEAYRS
jgi:hypothetical protein